MIDDIFFDLMNGIFDEADVAIYVKLFAYLETLSEETRSVFAHAMLPVSDSVMRNLI